jgi:hypothetical protein
MATRGSAPNGGHTRLADSDSAPDGSLLAESSVVDLHKGGFCDAVHVGGSVLAWAEQVGPFLPTH